MQLKDLRTKSARWPLPTVRGISQPHFAYFPHSFDKNALALDRKAESTLIKPKRTGYPATARQAIAKQSTKKEKLCALLLISRSPFDFGLKGDTGMALDLMHVTHDAAVETAFW